MKIGGLLKLSLIDYPGKISSVIFTQGCNLRCPYCHNPELVIPSKFNTVLPEKDIMEFLLKRRTQIDGVVFTGGEPLLQNDLIAFMREVKNMGHLIKLDTNGTDPRRLSEIIDLNLINYVAMDIKAPLEKYDLATGVNNSFKNIEESIKVIIESGIGHEFRTTLVKPFISEEDVPLMAALVKGSKKYILKNFVPQKDILDPSLTLQKENTFTEDDIRRLQMQIRGQACNFDIA